MENFNAKGANAGWQEQPRPSWTALGVYNGSRAEDDNLYLDLKRLTERIWHLVGPHRSGEYTVEELASDAYQGIKTRITNTGGRHANVESAGYCVMVIRNKARGRWKERRKRERGEGPLPGSTEEGSGEAVKEIEDSGPTPEEVGVRTELQRVLNEALAEINPRYAEVVRLSYFDQLSHGEIAEKLEISERNSAARLSRGLKQLAIVLADRGYTVDGGTPPTQRNRTTYEDGGAA